TPCVLSTRRQRADQGAVRGREGTVVVPLGPCQVEATPPCRLAANPGGALTTARSLTCRPQRRAPLRTRTTGAVAWASIWPRQLGNFPQTTCHLPMNCPRHSRALLHLTAQLDHGRKTRQGWAQVATR